MARNTSGRGRGRGRYHGRGKQQNNKPKTQESKDKDLSHLKFQVGTAKTASEFARIKKDCFSHITKAYTQGQYMQMALEDGKDFDFDNYKPPTLVLSPEEGTPSEIARIRSNNKSNEIEYNTKMKMYNEKVEQFIGASLRTQALIAPRLYSHLVMMFYKLIMFYVYILIK